MAPPARSGPSRRLAEALVALCSVAVLVLSAPPADAHVHLVASSPSHGETLAAVPAELVLVFDAPVRLAPRRALQLWVDGQELSLTPAVGRSANEIRAVVPEDVPAGGHRVEWRIVAADSHVEEGAFAYVVEGAGAGTTSPVADVSSDRQAGPGTAGAEPDVLAAAATGASSWNSLLVVAAVVLVSSLVASLILRGGRRDTLR